MLNLSIHLLCFLSLSLTSFISPALSLSLSLVLSLSPPFSPLLLSPISLYCINIPSLSPSSSLYLHLSLFFLTCPPPPPFLQFACTKSHRCMTLRRRDAHEKTQGLRLPLSWTEEKKWWGRTPQSRMVAHSLHIAPRISYTLFNDNNNDDKQQQQTTTTKIEENKYNYEILACEIF